VPQPYYPKLSGKRFLPFTYRIALDGSVRVDMCNNLLDCYSTVALTHQDIQVYEMLSSLTQLLNGNLLGSSLHSSYIPLEKELKYVDCYLFLQKIRFADRLTYT